MTHRRWDGQLLLLAALAILTLLPLALVRFPPLQDYPYHLVRWQILAAWSEPAFAYPETFARSLFPTPYALVDYAVAALAQLVPVSAAGKGVLALYLLAFPASVAYLVRALGPERTPLAFFALPWAGHWHYHMGFVAYSLAVAAALAAVGWWLRSGEREGWRPALVLGAWVTLTYLLHLYAWGILLFVLAVLAATSSRRRLLLSRLALGATPALLLLVALVVRSGAGGGEGHAWLLLYGNLRQKLTLAFDTFPALDPWRTAVLLAVTLLLALPLLWRLRRQPPRRELLAAVLALWGLFFLLPDHVGEVYFVANRVPLLACLLALPLLPAPPPGRSQVALVAALAGVLLVQVAGDTVRYRQVDRQLAAYHQVFEQLPRDARPAFWVERQAMQVGRVAPAAIFGGYHYLGVPGSRIPDLEHFAGAGRPVAYRERLEETMSTAAVRGEAALAEALGLRYLVGVGGALLVLGRDPAVAAAAEAWGFQRVLGLGGGTLYRKAEPRFLEPAPDERWYRHGYSEGATHLVAFGGAGPPPAEVALELLADSGVARLYRVRGAAAASSPACTPGWCRWSPRRPESTCPRGRGAAGRTYGGGHSAGGAHPHRASRRRARGHGWPRLEARPRAPHPGGLRPRVSAGDGAGPRAARPLEGRVTAPAPDPEMVPLLPRYDAVYLSPHLDDAVLSCGGQIHQRAARGEAVLVATAGTADETPPPWPELAAMLHRAWGLERGVVAARRAEDRAACRVLGAHWLHLGLPEAIYRSDARGAPRYARLGDLFRGVAAGDEGWAEELARRLEGLPACELLVAPLGVGGHVDHRLARRAVEGLGPQRVAFYEEYPYHARWWRRRRPAEAPAGWRSEVVALAAAEVAARCRAVAAYRSQVAPLFGNLARLERRIRRTVRRSGGERLWRPPLP